MKESKFDCIEKAKAFLDDGEVRCAALYTRMSIELFFYDKVVNMKMLPTELESWNPVEIYRNLKHYAVGLEHGGEISVANGSSKDNPENLDYIKIGEFKGVPKKIKTDKMKELSRVYNSLGKMVHADGELPAIHKLRGYIDALFELYKEPIAITLHHTWLVCPHCKEGLVFLSANPKLLNEIQFCKCNKCSKSWLGIADIHEGKERITLRNNFMETKCCGCEKIMSVNPFFTESKSGINSFFMREGGTFSCEHCGQLHAYTVMKRAISAPN